MTEYAEMSMTEDLLVVLLAVAVIGLVASLVQ
jgi:hypothetical protein